MQLPCLLVDGKWEEEVAHMFEKWLGEKHAHRTPLLCLCVVEHGPYLIGPGRTHTWELLSGVLGFLFDPYEGARAAPSKSGSDCFTACSFQKSNSRVFKIFNRARAVPKGSGSDYAVWSVFWCSRVFVSFNVVRAVPVEHGSDCIIESWIFSNFQKKKSYRLYTSAGRTHPLRAAPMYTVSHFFQNFNHFWWVTY